MSDEDEPHVVFYERCRICGFQAIGVAHHEADLTALECGNCHNMTSEAISKEEFEAPPFG